KTATCGTGLFCERQNKTCVAPRLNLEQCTPVWQSCKSGLFCACNHGPCDMVSVDFSKPAPTEVCEFQALDGESCTFAGKCLNGYCVNGKCASFPAYSFCDGIDDPKPDSGSGEDRKSTR